MNTDRQFHTGYQKICQNITSEFKRLRSEFSTSVMQRQMYAELNRIKNEIGPLVFGEYAPEVNEMRNRWYAELSRMNPGISSQLQSCKRLIGV